MEGLKINNAKFVSPDNKCIEFELEDLSTHDVFPFGYIVGSDDQSPITLWLNGLFYEGSITPEHYTAPVKSIEELSNEIRRNRERELNVTDRYMTLDYPISDEDRNALRAYRQALRDVPQQEGFPENVVWPDKPAFIK